MVEVSISVALFGNLFEIVMVEVYLVLLLVQVLVYGCDLYCVIVAVVVEICQRSQRDCGCAPPEDSRLDCLIGPQVEVFCYFFGLGEELRVYRYEFLYLGPFLIKLYLCDFHRPLEILVIRSSQDFLVPVCGRYAYISQVRDVRFPERGASFELLVDEPDREYQIVPIGAGDE